MLSRRWDEAETLFARGLEGAEAEREALLADVDPALAGAVRDLWKAYGSGTFLEDGPAGKDWLETYAPGHRVADRFTLIERLGTGGMGEVFRARDETLGRDVALKFLHPEFAADPEWRARLEHEARVACSLQHPSICTLYDLGWDAETPFLIMEHLEGETLAARLGRGPMPHDDVREIALQICSALRHAHSKGVVHRDLKPSNVMLTDVGVKVLDFGIAKRSPRSGSATATFTMGAGVAGSASYMSPEQAAAGEVDHRSDIFSFGSVLYEMLTGRKAFPGRSAWAAMAAVMAREPEPAAQIAPGCPPALAGTANRCLRKDPAERFQTAAEIEESLHGHAPRVRSPGKRWKLAAAVLGVAALVAVLLPALRRLNFPPQSNLNSVAVLPFTNEGNDPGAEYLADGLSEALTNALSRMPSLRVIARNTALAYKGQSVDPRTAGKRLNVRTLVSGRVHSRDGRLRIQADLVDTAGATQLWGNKYEGSSADLVSIEQRLVRDVSERLGAGRPDRQPIRPPTEKTEAFQLYMKGRQALARGGPGDGKKSIALFQQALEIDPLFAQSYAGIAEAYWNLAGFQLAPEDAMPKARAAAAKALEFDPELPEAHLSLGVIHYAYDFSWDRAAESFRRAIEFNPNYALAHLFYAWTQAVNGRFPEGIEEAKTAFELDPLSPFVETGLGQMYSYAGQADAAIRRLRNVVDYHSSFGPGQLWLGVAYLNANRLSEAATQLESAIRLDPSQGAPLAYLSYTLARQGDQRGAKREFARLRELAKDKYVTPYTFAVAAAGAATSGEMFAWLEQSFEIRDDTILMLNIDPIFRDYREDPRFLALLRKVGFDASGADRKKR